MTESGRPTLHLVADLTLDVDGVPLQVRGSGTEVTVTSGDLRKLFSAVRVAGGATTLGAPGRAEFARVADTLAEHGLTAALHGPAGRVLTLGAAVDSPAGSALLGTRRARVHPSAALRSAGPLLPAFAGLLVVLAALGVRRLRR